MKVHQILVGNMQNFTYVLEDEHTGEGIIIDPSWELDKIEQLVQRHDLKIKYIVNTHHHFDHTLGNEGMKQSTGAKIVQHKASELNLISKLPMVILFNLEIQNFLSSILPVIQKIVFV